MRKSILNMMVIAAAATAGAAHAATTVGSWTKVANQSAAFTIAGTGTKIVRYGTGTKWVVKGVTGTGQCTTAFFGKDPAAGVTKQCEVFSMQPAPVVVAPTAYDIKLSWTIPSTRQNGQALALSELKGYEVYYATDSDASTANDKVLTVTGGSINTSTISKLPAGTYYFSISAIDTNGVKSPLSAMVSKKVGS